MQAKKWIGICLALCLLLTVLPAQALAVTGNHGIITGRKESQMISAQLVLNAPASGPALSEGNHVRWIDRIKDLPDFARDFYTWLETNSAEGGLLVDPTGADQIQGSSGSLDTYVYKLHTISGSADFTYSGTNHDAAAQNAILSDLGDAHEIVASYASAVYGAFDRDHPEVFWLSGNAVYGYNIPYDYTYRSGKGTVTYDVELYFILKDPTFDLRNPDYQSASAILAAMEVQNNAMDAIIAQCPGDDPVEQLRTFNRILTTTNAYNSAVATGNQANASRDAWKGICALKGSTGIHGPVCEGYARAMMLLCQRVGIPCVLVEGPAKPTLTSTPITHMWNYVQLDGNWYAIDLTWNDIYSFAMPDTPNTGLETEEWFLMGGNTAANNGLTFNQTHTVTNYSTVDSLCYTNGPVLCEEAYAIPVTAPTLTLKYPSVSFEDEVLINVYFAAENLEDVVDLGLIVYSQEVAQWDIETAEAVVPGYTFVPEEGFYCAQTPGIAPKRLGDTLYMALYAQLTDGSYIYTKLVSYSPKTYAYAQLANGLEAMKPLVVAMLNYGAQAQKFFGYNTENLVNAQMTEAQQALVVPYSPDLMTAFPPLTEGKEGTFLRNGGYVNRYPTISFEGAFSINYYCTPEFLPADGVTLYFWNQTDFSAADVLTAENATAAFRMEGEGTGEYCAVIDGIAAKYLDQGAYVAFVYSDGTATYSTGILAYSIGTYCNTLAAGTSNQADLAKATAVYGYYARELLLK